MIKTILRRVGGGLRSKAAQHGWSGMPATTPLATLRISASRCASTARAERIRRKELRRRNDGGGSPRKKWRKRRTKAHTERKAAGGRQSAPRGRGAKQDKERQPAATRRRSRRRGSRLSFAIFDTVRSCGRGPNRDLFAGTLMVPATEHTRRSCAAGRPSSRRGRSAPRRGRNSAMPTQSQDASRVRSLGSSLRCAARARAPLSCRARARGGWTPHAPGPTPRSARNRVGARRAVGLSANMAAKRPTRAGRLAAHCRTRARGSTTPRDASRQKPIHRRDNDNSSCLACAFEALRFAAHTADGRPSTRHAARTTWYAALAAIQRRPVRPRKPPHGCQRLRGRAHVLC